MIRRWTTLRNAALALALGTAVPAWLAPAVAAQAEFPFGHELMLDVKPMKGSKRVPTLDIDDKGIAEIDLWCNSVKGRRHHHHHYGRQDCAHLPARARAGRRRGARRAQRGHQLAARGRRAGADRRAHDAVQIADELSGL
jgi:hypothetical protein